MAKRFRIEEIENAISVYGAFNQWPKDVRQLIIRKLDARTLVNLGVTSRLMARFLFDINVWLYLFQRDYDSALDELFMQAIETYFTQDEVLAIFQENFPGSYEIATEIYQQEGVYRGFILRQFYISLTHHWLLLKSDIMSGIYGEGYIIALEANPSIQTLRKLGPRIMYDKYRNYIRTFVSVHYKTRLERQNTSLWRLDEQLTEAGYAPFSRLYDVMPEFYLGLILPSSARKDKSYILFPWVYTLRAPSIEQYLEWYVTSGYPNEIIPYNLRIGGMIRTAFRNFNLLTQEKPETMHLSFLDVSELYPDVTLEVEKIIRIAVTNILQGLRDPQGRLYLGCAFCGKQDDVHYQCCSNTRYCNDVCQAAHWSTHKLHCKREK